LSRQNKIGERMAQMKSGRKEKGEQKQKSNQKHKKARDNGYVQVGPRTWGEGWHKWIKAKTITHLDRKKKKKSHRWWAKKSQVGDANVRARKLGNSHAWMCGTGTLERGVELAATI